MKRIIFMLGILQICNMLFAQEFSTKLYFESAAGEKDTLEIGYDSKASSFPSLHFGEKLYDSPFCTNDQSQLFFIDPWWWLILDPPIKSGYYTKRRIIKKINDVVYDSDIITGMIVPKAFLPLTISWDNAQSENIKNEYCFFTDRHFLEFSYLMNKLAGEAWDYAKKIDIRESGSIQFTTINDSYDIYDYDPSDPDAETCTSPPYGESPFAVLYFGFIDPGKYLGINDLKGNTKLSVFPNPVVDYCSVKKEEMTDIAQIQIFSISGKKMMSMKGDVSKIDCRNLSEGIYMIEFTGVNNERYYCKMIKK